MPGTGNPNKNDKKLISSILFLLMDRKLIRGLDFDGVFFFFKTTGVQVSQVTYRGFDGTSSTEVAINLNCSRAVPCIGISMESINLVAAGVGRQVIADCGNAHGKETRVVPRPCLQN